MIWLNLKSKGEVDALYREWSASNAKLLSAPESKPWGLHEFTAADLDGNLFRVFYDFATPEREKTRKATLVFVHNRTTRQRRASPRRARRGGFVGFDEDRLSSTYQRKPARCSASAAFSSLNVLALRVTAGHHHHVQQRHRRHVRHAVHPCLPPAPRSTRARTGRAARGECR